MRVLLRLPCPRLQVRGQLAVLRDTPSGQITTFPCPEYALVVERKEGHRDRWLVFVGPKLNHPLCMGCGLYLGQPSSSSGIASD